ncbi:MAG TPA: phosphoribosylaminoimidazolesuccinocarboxamide synthase [Thermoanaerobaculia bacterium]|nr:phosphoribosylaminoimidazolesuccinocarboxamide synthase [Thermoanaerobaculia bacterium]
METVWETKLPNLPPPRRGKVRDVYDLGRQLLIVATDRLSAYDHVLRPGIPGKGKILTQLSNFWFARLSGVVPHHLVTTDPDEFPASLQPHRDLLAGRSVVVRKAEVIPFECVARGYLAGSGFREYRRTRAVCGIDLPDGLELAARLPEPIFTPATKAEVGHDENVSFKVMEDALGTELSSRLRDLTLELYQRGAEHAAACELILADTKLEFGLVEGEVILIDEVLTPDSSRYWEAAEWLPGREPVSFDKQFVRNWLDSTGWDKSSTPPELPPEVVAGTQERYRTAFVRLTGREPEL